MIKGIDVSHHNGIIDWPKVKGAGFDFAFCKATQGVSFTDSTFQRNMVQGQAAGILMGAYHFFDPRLDPYEQVSHFMDQLRTLKRPFLVAGDFEWLAGDPQPWSAYGSQTRTEMVNLFMDTLLINYKTKPFLYTSPAFANEYLQGVALGFYPLWLARYKDEDLPPAWRYNAEIHQYTESGDVPGVPSKVDDVNRSNLTLDQLTSLAVRA